MISTISLTVLAITLPQTSQTLHHRLLQLQEQQGGILVVNLGD